MQVAVSLLASTLYFYFRPFLTQVREIIARTSPTIWDVVIAFVGGLAGIIDTKEEANNIVPGCRHCNCSYATRLYRGVFYCHRKS
ncbi:MAG: DUF389 domain-containing protein [Streptococcus salivarius]